MMEVGRLCIKIAGRDSGQKCVVIDVLDSRSVMIDGSTRRRKCNISHLEPLKETINIKKGASHADVAKEFDKLGIKLKETKPKKKSERPRQIRSEQRKKMAEEAAPKKKKEEKKVAEKKEPAEEKKTEAPKAEEKPAKAEKPTEK